MDRAYGTNDNTDVVIMPTVACPIPVHGPMKKEKWCNGFFRVPRLNF
jgi:hypothetical protein